MKSAEIRSTYLRFFQERGHQIHPSASLVPEDDPTLLFTGAGMNQFKDMFLGRGSLGFTRATTTQKCLRVPDLDEVGRTPSHHTFFEMLGNFSFGDYFKEEAIAWADELLRNQFGLDRSRLLISVYEEDDEAFDLWRKIGYAKDRIFRYGEKDNFWPSESPSKGPNGPCGPCSEIYVDFGEEFGGGDPASNGRRYAEIWNLVFTQFERRDGGELAALPQKNIDTGMGFERLTRVLQGGATNFDTDLFQPILASICERSSRAYGEDAEVDRSMRRIADHVRAAVFCAADGLIPSNEKQGYVVRKILRRAIADGMDVLRIGGAFAGDLVPAVIGVPGMTDTFPELLRHQERIERIIREEEQKFLETYERGRDLLEREILKLQKQEEQTMPGRVAFYLWDTAGFPIDLTQRVLEDRGLGFDQDGFDSAMEEQRQKSRAGSNIKGEIFDTGPLAALKEELGPTRFEGHQLDDLETPVTAILVGGERVTSASQGQEVRMVFAATPFYAESGGQVGDHGSFTTATGRVDITNTTKEEGFFIHAGVVREGALAAGDLGNLSVDRPGHREPTMRNHTATHLLHWALRRVLGDKVEQQGSLVGPGRLRFDFSWQGAVSAEQLAEVERLANEQVVRNRPVAKEEKSLDEALKDGAMALFGEKYGDRVRVVRVEDDWSGGASVELCGGTHVERTGDIGLIKVTSESGISAGVRRIEAITGLGALQRFQEREGALRELARGLKTAPDQIQQRVDGLQEEIRRLKKELAQASRASAGQDLEALVSQQEQYGDTQVVVASVAVDGDRLATLADQVKERLRGAWCLVLAGQQEGSIPVLAMASEEAQALGLKAGDLCRQLAKGLGGGGGGKPGFARGKGSDPHRLPAALEEVRNNIRAALGA